MPQPVPRSRWDFPDVALLPAGEEVAAVGADLEPGTLVEAYSRGLFPMPIEAEGDIGWWSPDPRGILPLNALRVTRSMRKSERHFTVTVDTAFDKVVERCADPRRPLPWIDGQIRQAYGRMHQLGWAHSVEVWDDAGVLVGGLYGIEVGGLFAGESMFHDRRDASKVALMELVRRLAAAPSPEVRLLDVQWRSEHLGSLGVIAVPRPDYLLRLNAAMALPPALG